MASTQEVQALDSADSVSLSFLALGGSSGSRMVGTPEKGGLLPLSPTVLDRVLDPSSFSVVVVVVLPAGALLQKIHVVSPSRTFRFPLQGPLSGLPATVNNRGCHVALQKGRQAQKGSFKSEECP